MWNYMWSILLLCDTTAIWSESKISGILLWKRLLTLSFHICLFEIRKYLFWLSAVTMKHDAANIRNTRWDTRRLKLSFDYSRPGNGVGRPPHRQRRLLVAPYFTVTFFLLYYSLTHLPPWAGIVSSTGNQGCDKQTLSTPHAALLLNYKIPAHHWRRSPREWR